MLKEHTFYKDIPASKLFIDTTSGCQAPSPQISTIKVF